MIPLVEHHLSNVAELCHRYDVRRLDLFGSAATGDFDVERSDLDFMVEFVSSEPEGAADRYFGLMDELQGIFGLPVDLIVRGAVRNPYFLQAADRDRINLYGA